MSQSEISALATMASLYNVDLKKLLKKLGYLRRFKMVIEADRKHHVAEGRDPNPTYQDSLAPASLAPLSCIKALHRCSLLIPPLLRSRFARPWSGASHDPSPVVQSSLYVRVRVGPKSSVEAHDPKYPGRLFRTTTLGSAYRQVSLHHHMKRGRRKYVKLLRDGWGNPLLWQM